MIRPKKSTPAPPPHPQSRKYFSMGTVLVFDRVNHLGILYKLCSVGVSGYTILILWKFIGNWQQKSTVDFWELG